MKIYRIQHGYIIKWNRHFIQDSLSGIGLAGLFFAVAVLSTIIFG